LNFLGNSAPAIRRLERRFRLLLCGNDAMGHNRPSRALSQEIRVRFSSELPGIRAEVLSSLGATSVPTAGKHSEINQSYPRERIRAVIPIGEEDHDPT
jgi:hypothetical protein